MGVFYTSSSKRALQACIGATNRCAMIRRELHSSSDFYKRFAMFAVTAKKTPLHRPRVTKFVLGHDTYLFYNM